MKKNKIFWIFLLALLVRIIIAPLTYHGDTIDVLNWSINLKLFGLKGFYLRDIPDAGPPNYPPGFYVLFYLNQVIYEFFKNIIWFINVNIKIFPSNLYLWFESSLGNIFFNKLPAIFADIGIAYLIYKIVEELKNKKEAIKTSIYFLFSIPIFYISSAWGQTESLFALPLIGAFYALKKDKFRFSLLLFLSSLLIKPTALLLLPVFLYVWLKRVEKKDIVPSIFLSLVLFFAVHIPFSLGNVVSFIENLYLHGVREISGYLVANAFNLWSFIYGFKPISSSVKIIGIQASYLGWGIFISIVLCVIYRLRNDFKLLLLGLSTISFAGFLFLTQMHERYIFLTLVFLAASTFINKRVKILYLIVSFVALINLYHYWWVPKIPFFVKLFINNIIVKTLIIVNFISFYFVFREFLKYEIKKVKR